MKIAPRYPLRTPRGFCLSLVGEVIRPRLSDTETVRIVRVGAIGNRVVRYARHEYRVPLVTLVGIHPCAPIFVRYILLGQNLIGRYRASGQAISRNHAAGSSTSSARYRPHCHGNQPTPHVSTCEPSVSAASSHSSFLRDQYQTITHSAAIHQLRAIRAHGRKIKKPSRQCDTDS